MNDENMRGVRVGVIVCDCGYKIAEALDTEALCQQAGEIPEVVYTAHEGYPCSKDGQERIRQAITAQKLNRVLVAGCAPRLVEKLFRQAVEPELDPAYLNVADVREQVAYVHASDHPSALANASGLIEMGVAKLVTTTSPLL